MQIGFIPKTEKDLRFSEEFRKKGVDVKLLKKDFFWVDFEDLSFGYFSRDENFENVVKELDNYHKNYRKYDLNLLELDLIFLRFNEFSLSEKDMFFSDVLEMLENNKRIINSVNSIKCSKNKHKAYYFLKRSGIKIPKTFMSNDPIRTYFKLNELNNWVFKPMTGKGGTGIVITNDKSTAGDLTSLFAVANKVPILQEFIENDKDIRIIVVGDEVLGGIYRIAKKGIKKNGISLGGEARAFNPDDELKETALKASKTIGCDISGIDIIERKNEHYVLEVNSSPGFTGFQRATNINVYEKIADYIIKEIKK